MSTASPSASGHESSGASIIDGAMHLFEETVGEAGKMTYDAVSNIPDGLVAGSEDLLKTGTHPSPGKKPSGGGGGGGGSHGGGGGHAKQH